MYGTMCGTLLCKLLQYAIVQSPLHQAPISPNMPNYAPRCVDDVVTLRHTCTLIDPWLATTVYSRPLADACYAA